MESAHRSHRRTSTRFRSLPGIGSCLLAAFLLAPFSARGDEPKPAEQPPTQEQLDAKFAARFTRVVMAGQYTIGEGKPKSDKYTIESVRKLKGDNWLFNARIEFAGKDVTIPIILPVKWAGDTPVISVSNVGFPGLGSYSARVMIYGDHYAGMWQDMTNKAHGGLLWGKLEKAPPAEPAAKPDAKP